MLTRRFLASTLTLILTLSFLIAGLFTMAQNARAAISYGSGYYINLCGSGTAASSHSCSQQCDINSGSCSASGNTVVRYQCDGKNVDCRQNESGFSSSQSLGSPGCGKTVQIDVFDKTCRLSNGGWDESCVLRDYIVWYSGDCESQTPPPSQTSCQDYQEVNTQFRKSFSRSWVSGQELTNQKVKVGNRIDVNCFAKTGSTLLPDASIFVTYPDGRTEKIRDSAEVRFYKIQQSGQYTFTCDSRSIAQCSNTDSFSIESVVEPTPSPTPSPQVTPTPKVTPTPQPRSCQQTCSASKPCDDGLNCIGGACRNPVCSSERDCICDIDAPKSICEDLDVVGGNDQRVPSDVTLRAQATDNKGNIREYKFFFGDGKTLNTTDKEVTHKYESSGRFVAKVEAKDSRGKWISSEQCEADVTVKSSPVESHKADCSDVFIVERSNSGRAPSTFKFKVTGFDNKGDIQEYKIQFGDNTTGSTAEKSSTDSQTFEHRYETAGTYQVKGFIKDSHGNWQGGDDGCTLNAFVETEPLTKQPDTGTPTALSLIGVFSGSLGVALRYAKKRVTG